MRAAARFAAGCALALLCARPGAAQHEHHSGHGERPWGIGAQAVGLVTHATHAVDGRDLTEGYLTQPAVMAHANLWNGRLRGSGMLNLEGWTLRRGELNAGVFGEGYIDRRHPHTFLHELTATGVAKWGGAEWSLTAGKGFAPFGTDDPMVRPLVKYPVNHHLAQILERGVAIGAVRRGPAILEAGLFNGDEPIQPEDGVNWGRFGDSWAARATLLPRPGWELQASYAAVESPELPGGGGLDGRKASASARWSGGAAYALVEWARTAEYEDGRRYHTFTSALAEGAVRRGSVQLAARLERTERPEEERLADPFRSPRPHADFALLATTRWTVVSGAISGRARPFAALGVSPFVEVGYAHAATVEPSVFFDPAEFYGSQGQWSLSAGVRLEAGRVHRRMGRYGVADVPVSRVHQP